MPCRQVSTFNGVAASSGSYATEADCNQACKEGACCEGTTCSVKPQCQCQGSGQVFKGVGTVCSPNPCLLCASSCSNAGLPQQLKFSITSCSIPAANLTFNPVGDWIVDLESTCQSYGAKFFNNASPVFLCFPPLCFTGCSHKLIIGVSLAGGFYGGYVVIADINPNTGAPVGGEAYDRTQRMSQICSRSLPISGTLSLSDCGAMSLAFTLSQA